VKAADISDREFVAAVDCVERETGMWAMWWMNTRMQRLSLDEALPRFPRKVLLAKARRVLGRGYLEGCACGCRGDFQVTPEGAKLLDRYPAPITDGSPEPLPTA
jgi:hypothetical protein